MIRKKQEKITDRLFKIQQSFQKPLMSMNNIRQNAMDMRLAIEKRDQPIEQVFEKYREFRNSLSSIVEAVEQITDIAVDISRFVYDYLPLPER